MRVQRVAPPLGHTLRAGLCVGVPVALGFALDHVAVGVTVGLACVLRAIGEREGPHRRNVVTLLIATPIAAFGYLFGLVQGLPLAPLVAVMALFAFAMGTLAPHGEGFALGGMQVLLVASIALGIPDTGTAAAIGWFLLGASIYAAAMAVDFFLLEPRRPEGIALRALDDAVVSLLASPGPAERRAAHVALAAARAVPSPGWADSDDGVARWGGYAAVVAAADDLVAWEAAAAAPDAARRVAYHQARTGWTEGRTSRPPAVRDRAPRSSASAASLAAVGHRWLRPDARTRAHAGRLALCFGLAVSSRGWVGLDHWFWVPATVGLVMQPDFGSVFGRSVLRVAGTVVGSVVAAVVLWAVPDGLGLGLAVGLVAATIPWAKQASYVMQSVALAAVVLLLVDQIAPATGALSLPVQRVLATAVGGAIVLVFGYLIWPGARRVAITGQVAVATEAIAEIVRSSAEPVPADDAGRATRRRTHVDARHRAFDALASARVPLARAAAEPPPASTDAAAWSDAVDAVEALGICASDHAIARLGGAMPPEDPVALADAVARLGRVADPAVVEDEARALARRVRPDGDAA